MILAAVVACEIAFWVVILGGLTARYLLRRPRLGVVLLAAAPVIDVALLVLATSDLLNGATASWQHGLAAIYVGVSVAYGRRMVIWTDTRYKYRFAGGEAPERLVGARYTAKCWRDAILTTLAVGIAGAILGVTIWIVDDSSRTEALSGFFNILGVLVVIDVVWALSYTIWPKRPKQPLGHVER